jgi:molybdenum cofactor biosynthesis enzyme MoaA
MEPTLEYNNKFRIKLTEQCNLSCPFCHHEGTSETEEVSIKDSIFCSWIKSLREYFDVVHLTGGEPTLYRDLGVLCKFLKDEGYKIYLTSNMVKVSDSLRAALPYLSKINVSLHSLNPDYFQNFIKFNSNAKAYLDAITKNILEIQKAVQEVSINTVVSNDEKQDLKDVLSFCQANDLMIKLVPDWRYYDKAKECIFKFIEENGYKETDRVLKTPGSNLRITFTNKKRHRIEFKDIKPYYLSFWCEDCRHKRSCIETFAFLRLEGNPIRFKVCIGRPALSYREFEERFWPAYRKLINETKSRFDAAV